MKNCFLNNDGWAALQKKLFLATEYLRKLWIAADLTSADEQTERKKYHSG